MIFKKIKKHFNSQKGVALYFSMIIMTIILALALGISTLIVGQFKMVGEMGYSVAAFYGADTGLEEGLYKYYIENNTNFDIGPQPISAGSPVLYSVKGRPGNTVDCPDPSIVICYEAWGNYNGIVRGLARYLGF